MRATLTVCSQPGCPELTTAGRCAEHHRAARRGTDRQRPGARQRGYGTAWERTRARFLAQHPHCQHLGCERPATDVHHFDGLGPNGPSGYDWTNLQGLCHSHHSQRTAREQSGWSDMSDGGNRETRRRRRRSATGPFVVLCGFSGVGKTTVRTLLAARLGAVSLGRDDCGGWNEVYDALDRADLAVVECVRVPRALRRKISERAAIVVELLCPIETRRQRLTQRGEPSDVIASRLAETGALGYEDDLVPDISLDTTGSAEQLIVQILHVIGRMCPRVSSPHEFSAHSVARRTV